MWNEPTARARCWDAERVGLGQARSWVWGWQAGGLVCGDLSLVFLQVSLPRGACTCLSKALFILSVYRHCPGKCKSPAQPTRRGWRCGYKRRSRKSGTAVRCRKLGLSVQLVYLSTLENAHRLAWSPPKVGAIVVVPGGLLPGEGLWFLVSTHLNFIKHASGLAASTTFREYCRGIYGCFFFWIMGVLHNTPIQTRHSKYSIVEWMGKNREGKKKSAQLFQEAPSAAEQKI